MARSVRLECADAYKRGNKIVANRASKIRRTQENANWCLSFLTEKSPYSFEILNYGTDPFWLPLRSAHSGPNARVCWEPPDAGPMSGGMRPVADQYSVTGIRLAGLSWQGVGHLGSLNLDDATFT